VGQEVIKANLFRLFIFNVCMWCPAPHVSPFKKNVWPVMVINSTDINKTKDHRSPQIVKHKKRPRQWVLEIQVPNLYRHKQCRGVRFDPATLFVPVQVREIWPRYIVCACTSSRDLTPLHCLCLYTFERFDPATLFVPVQVRTTMGVGNSGPELVQAQTM
jgi:hypothetical protein